MLENHELLVQTDRDLNDLPSCVMVGGLLNFSEFREPTSQSHYRHSNIYIAWFNTFCFLPYPFPYNGAGLGVRPWISVRSHHSVHHTCLFNKRRGWGFSPPELCESEPSAQSGQKTSPFAVYSEAILSPERNRCVLFGACLLLIVATFDNQGAGMNFFFLYHLEPISHVYSTIHHLWEKLGAYQSSQRIKQRPNSLSLREFPRQTV